MKNAILIILLVIGLSSKSQERYIQFSDYPLEHTTSGYILARFDLQTGKPYYVLNEKGKVTFTLQSDSLITTNDAGGSVYKLQDIYDWKTNENMEIKSYKAIDQEGQECYFSIIYKIKEDRLEMMVTYEKFMFIYTE